MPRPRRPFLLRALPLSLRQSVWGRFYRPTPERFLSLYQAASLYFAPSVVMTRLVPGDAISDSIAFTGIFDLDVTRWVLTIARQRAGVFVEVGASLGYFSLLWAAQHVRNQAIAFEASPRVVELFEHNIRVNGLSDRIAVHCQAIGAKRGSMQFNSGPPVQTGWGHFESETSTASISVSVVPLDEALCNLPEIAVLLIDIQGADFWALQGAERILRERRIQHIMWKESKLKMRQLGIPPGESLKLMLKFGYNPMPHGDPASDVVRWSARL